MKRRERLWFRHDRSERVERGGGGRRGGVREANDLHLSSKAGREEHR